MMILEIKTALLSYDVEVVMSARPYLTGTDESAKEGVIGIVHAIHAENGFKAVLVKCLVVGYQRQPFYFRSYLSPHFGEDRSILRVLLCETVYLRAESRIVIRLGMDK